MSKIVFVLFLAILMAAPLADAVTIRATIAGAGTWNDGGTLKILPNNEFRIEIYSLNNDTILPPPYEERTTWSTPFTFTGDVAVQWLDVITDSVSYLDDPHPSQIQHLPIHRVLGSFQGDLLGIP